MDGLVPAIHVVVRDKHFLFLIQAVVPPTERSLVTFMGRPSGATWMAVTSTAMAARALGEPGEP
jgi:hypothetical protein